MTKAVIIIERVMVWCKIYCFAFVLNSARLELWEQMPMSGYDENRQGMHFSKLADVEAERQVHERQCLVQRDSRCELETVDHVNMSWTGRAISWTVVGSGYFHTADAVNRQLPHHAAQTPAWNLEPEQTRAAQSSLEQPRAVQAAQSSPEQSIVQGNPEQSRSERPKAAQEQRRAAQGSPGAS